MNIYTAKYLHRWLSTPMNIYIGEYLCSWISAQLNICTGEYLHRWIFMQLNIYKREYLHSWIYAKVNIYAVEHEYLHGWTSAFTFTAFDTRLYPERRTNVCTGKYLHTSSTLFVFIFLFFHYIISLFLQTSLEVVERKYYLPKTCRGMLWFSKQDIPHPCLWNFFFFFCFFFFGLPFIRDLSQVSWQHHKYILVLFWFTVSSFCCDLALSPNISFLL